MQLGWIDFSKQDRTNAINIINSMKEKGVLDELGFGSLRQAFADFFFPGTSTIQTRAKYFFIFSITGAPEGRFISYQIYRRVR